LGWCHKLPHKSNPWSTSQKAEADPPPSIALAMMAATLRDGYPRRRDIFNFFAGSPERTHRLLDLELLPWWTSPEARVAFWRRSAP
jgi:hypothetical protein